MKKVYPDATAALDGLLFDGMLIAAGGFGLCGIPELCIAAIRAAGTKNLTVASNNAGVDGFGLGVLLESRQVKKMISSYVGENAEFMRQYLSGELELEFNPQGTLAERMRAGGAGIPGFYTKTGVGTVIAEGKDRDGFRRPGPISSNAASSPTCPSSRRGRPTLRAISSSARPPATSTRRRPCGKVCVAEVEEIVPLGSLDPDHIHLPGIYVHRLIQGQHEKRIEQRTVRKRENAYGWDRNQMAARAAQELQDGWYVNLGIGIPDAGVEPYPQGDRGDAAIGKRHAWHGPLSL